ncbi:MAG TPA: hypothetical protein PL156_07950 [Rhodoglobus sp.]|nr:hypothetical protein [Rhodoglobus sp.]
MTQIQVGTQMFDTDEIDEADVAAKATEQILAAHKVVNDAIGSGQYPVFTPANAEAVSRPAQKAMLRRQLELVADLLLVTMELFDRGDCDDAVIGVFCYLGNITQQVSNMIRRGWSPEQLAEYQRQLESVVISLSPDDLPPVVELAKNILGPMIDANRAEGVLAALSAQIREAGGCGDPQCVACSGAATADEPIEGDTTIADLESRADFGEAVEEQGE